MSDSARLAPPRHLWVRLPNPLGDAVMATVALRALRAALPATRITWAGGPAVSEALAGLSDRDDVMPVAGRMARGPLAPWRLGREIRRLGPDAALLLPNSFSSALAARLGGARVRVGVQRDGRRALLTHAVTVPEARGRLVPRSMVDHYLDAVAPFGARGDGGPPRLGLTPFGAESAARRRAALGLADAPLLAVSPGAAFGPSKRYPVPRLAEAVRTLAERAALVPLVLCGPGEENLARAVAGAIGPGCAHTAQGPPDLGELKALLAGARLHLASDSGPRHVGEALGVPTVVWVGPTDRRFAAHSPARVVSVDSLSCLGCHLRRCPIGHPCMEDLAPERLVAAGLEALAAAGEAPRAG